MPRRSPRAYEADSIKNSADDKQLAAKVALIGRVNVGKSSLFNRLIGRKRALVSPEPGTTRDRQEGLVEWANQLFQLIDTGGVEAILSQKNNFGEEEPLAALIKKQTEEAITTADLVLLMVSAEDGLMPQDLAWAAALRGRLPVLLVVNKVDNQRRASALSDFYRLGLGEPIPVSAANGRGSGDLLDIITNQLKKIKIRATGTPPENFDFSFAILGQPNSGKSSFLNAVLGEQRVIVSPIPRTTREPIDTHIEYNGKKINLIDTAGIRRKANVTAGVESLGVEASLKTVEQAEAVLLLIDLTRGPSFQDQRLASLIAEQGRGLVLVANKWDLVPNKEASSMKEAELALRRQLPGLDWAPIVFISAKTGQRVYAALDAAIAAAESRGVKLEESELNKLLRLAIKQHRPSRGGGVQHPSIVSFKQTGIEPPTFTIVTRGELHPSYLKFLENRLREVHGFVGSPIHLGLRALKKRIKK